MGSPVAVIRRSCNRKLSTNSQVNATYVSQVTCPKNCPFYHNGCYAELGPMGYVTTRLNRTKETRPTAIIRLEANKIRKLDARFPLRLHVVGDCANTKSAKLLADACSEYKRKFEQPIWCYTHNRTIPRDAWGDISILRSCTTLRQVEVATKAGFASSLVVSKFKNSKRYYIGKGLYGIPCPAQTGLIESCVKCQLCCKDQTLLKNKNIILFEAHGRSKNRIIATL